MTLASIVIPSRGGAGRLPQLLSALAAQDDMDWQAIVVLDGDVDDSGSVVARYSHLPVRAIVFPENRGRVAALNAGFDAAEGEVLIRCDDDLIPTPDYVRLHKASHQREPGGTIGLYLNRLPETPYARAYGRAADDRFRRDAYRIPSDKLWRYWAGNASTTRDWWNRVGPYDPAYRAYGWEDVDWGYRLHAAGAPIRLDPTLETTHAAAAVTTRSRVKRAFHSGAARHTFENLHGDHILPTPVPEGGWWNAAVRSVARVGSRERLDLLARITDAALPGMPGPLATKAVALLVEGAGVSGYQHPDQTRTDF